MGTKRLVKSTSIDPRKGLWFPTHVHSHYSALDGMASVKDLVHKAKLDGRPALGLNDHGNMAGTTELYKACKAEGLRPFPGFEAYMLDPEADDPMQASTKRYHLCINALDLKGYKALVRFNSLSHTRPRFNKFPRHTFNDFVEFGQQYGNHVFITTGCYFGLTQQRLVSNGVKAAKQVVKALATWFPNTVVELQNHHIEHPDDWTDEDIVAALIEIADELGLPVIATPDSHYLNQPEKEVHALMKRMVYGGVEDEFPGDSFHLPSAEWVAEHYTDSQWRRIEEGAQYLLDKHNLVIPALDKFTPQVPSMAKDPDAKLWDVVSKRLRKLTADMTHAKQRAYQERALFEFDIIKHVGMSDYFLLVLEVVEWCRKKHVCIEARGSANGSLICYVLGITQVDPIKWKSPFERFLSKDRIKPPDIDIDVEDVRRQELLAYLRQRFPTVSIGTWGELGITVDAETGEPRGSVFRTYQSYLRRRAYDEAKHKLTAKHARQQLKPPTKKAVDEYARAIFAKKYGWVQTVEDVRKLDARDYRALIALGGMKVYRSYSTHAGGVLLGTSKFKFEDYIPVMLVASVDNGVGKEKGRPVTQFDMNALEEWGLLKLDVLGQATLTVMRKCQEYILASDNPPPGLTDPTDFSWIPYDDPKACRLLREGRTDTGIFHFEGWTKSKGGRELGIKSTKDVILATALYMPGATNDGAKDEYLRRRRRGSGHYIHPIFERVLKDTLGVMVYQDDPLTLLREMGMSIESINTLYKVLKDSGKGAEERNRERMASIRKEFDYHCAKHGIPADEAWRMITSFNAYGMNRAHASGYGIRSYRCAYLKAHYPVEFMGALLAVVSMSSTAKKKEPKYVREARRLGIRISPPRVNESEVTYTVTGRRSTRRIIKGLVSVPGVGVSTAAAIADGAPYASVEDLVKRARPNGRILSGGKEWLASGALTGVLGALERAGALDDLDNQEGGGTD